MLTFEDCFRSSPLRDEVVPAIAEHQRLSRIVVGTTQTGPADLMSPS